MDKSDFQGMKYDVFKDRQSAIWTQYPLLMTRPDLCQVPAEFFWEERNETPPTWQDLDILMRFVIIFCSQERNNPLAAERDFIFRRDTAMNLVGIYQGDPLKEMIENWHPWVVTCMAVFMKMDNSTLYNTWLSLLISYYQDVTYIMASPQSSDDVDRLMAGKTRIKAGLNARYEELQQMATRVFPTMEVAEEVSKHETGIFDGIGSYPEYMVAKDWPLKKTPR